MNSQPINETSPHKTQEASEVTSFLQSLQQQPSFEDAKAEFEEFCLSHDTEAADSLARLLAICILVRLGHQSRSREHAQTALQLLKRELNRLQRNRLAPDQLRQLVDHLLELSEALGNARQWPAVKTITRAILNLEGLNSAAGKAKRIRALNNLGSAFLGENRIEDAINVWQCTINDYDELADSTDYPPLSSIHNNLAELRRVQCRMVLALKHHARAYELRSISYPNDHILLQQSRLNYAQVLLDCYQYENANAIVDEYLSAADGDAATGSTLLRGQILKCRANLNSGRYLTAESSINKLMRSTTQQKDVSDRLLLDLHLLRLEIAILLGKTNVILSELNKLPEQLSPTAFAESAYAGRYQKLLSMISTDIEHEELAADRELHAQSGLKIFRKRLPRYHPLIAEAILQLADVFNKTKRQQRAGQTASSALSIFEQCFGDQSMPWIRGLIRIAEFQVENGQCKPAHAAVKTAIRQQRNRPQLPSVTLFRLYDLASHTYEFKAKPRVAAFFAEAACQQMAEALEFPASQQEPHVDRAIALAKSVGHYHRAIRLTQRKIELLSTEFHDRHPRVALEIEHLGELYAAEENYAQAAESLTSVLPVRCGELGEETQPAMDYMERTVEVLRLAGDDQQADEIERQVQSLNDRSAHVLSDLL